MAIPSHSKFNDIGLLYGILQHRRPAKSSGEKIFIKNYLDTIDGMQKDGYGNRYLKQGTSETMFSCHTDTVHKDDDKQKVYIDPISGHVFTGGVLGADDGAGIYIMLNMIEAGVPGLYVFHREEEIGGNGSVYFGQNNKSWEGMKRCIAFDRKGYNSVITEQLGTCCSDEFGLELAGLLNQHDLNYVLDDTGLFTDSANYTHLIPECTNLSVGYFNQHTANEYQDTNFLMKLTDACIALDWESLGVYKAVENEMNYYNGYGATNYGSKFTEVGAYAPYDVDMEELLAHLKAGNYNSVLNMVSADPDLGAATIFELYDELARY
jgi:hypothetical protein